MNINITKADEQVKAKTEEEVKVDKALRAKKIVIPDILFQAKTEEEVKVDKAKEEQDTNEDRQAISKQLGIIKSNTILVHTHCKDMMSNELLTALRIMYCNARYLEQRYKLSTDSSIELINQLLIDYYKLAALLKDKDEFCDKYLQNTFMRINHIKNYLQK